LKDAPINDRSFEFWALNDMFKVLPEGVATRWFQIHTRKVAALPTKFSPEGCLEWCKTATIPVYMQDKYEDCPCSLKYPLEEILAKFKRRYFTSTPAYMVAMALYEGFEEIRLFGIDMSVGTEWGIEKPCMEYWLGRADGMGVDLILPDGSDLLKGHFLYGFEEETRDAFIDKAKAKLAQAREQKKEAENKFYVNIGLEEAWSSILREIGG
jgi:hypothetical protein